LCSQWVNDTISNGLRPTAHEGPIQSELWVLLLLFRLFGGEPGKADQFLELVRISVHHVPLVWNHIGDKLFRYAGLETNLNSVPGEIEGIGEPFVLQ
jgi:hypothetical protein